MSMSDYYNRYTPEKNWDAVLFRADRVLQSAEVNEIQSILDAKRRGIGDALFKDGDIVKGCGLFVNPLSGEARVEAGLIYISGAVRAVPEATFTIAITGTVTVGVFLAERTLTELDDASLHNPAIGSQGFGEAGAARRVVSAAWGFFGQDVTEGEFYPVYNVDDGSLRVKETPPALDSVTQAIAAYDTDSAGGSYAVSGLTLTALPDAVDGKQVYSLAEGRARVQGFGIELPQSRRIVYDAQPDLLYVETEPHQSNGPTAQRLIMERNPVKNYTRLAFTHEKKRQFDARLRGCKRSSAGRFGRGHSGGQTGQHNLCQRRGLQAHAVASGLESHGFRAVTGQFVQCEIPVYQDLEPVRYERRHGRWYWRVGSGRGRTDRHWSRGTDADFRQLQRHVAAY